MPSSSTEAQEMEQNPLLSHVSASVLYDWQRGFIQHEENSALSIPVAVKDKSAIIVILDLSGYTRATQLLMEQAEQKNIGTMESFNASQYVGRMVKFCLDPLLQLVNAYGGDMLNYGGDALFCIWREIDESYSARVTKALLCCIEATKWVRQHPLLDFDNQKMALAVHAVIHACEVDLLHLGDSFVGHLECVAYGDEYLRACDLLANAKHDEIVITQSTLTLIDLNHFNNIQLHQKTNEYTILSVDIKSEPLPPSDKETFHDQIMAQCTSLQSHTITKLYVDPIISHRPIGTAEMRQATIAFMRLSYTGSKESFLWSVNDLLTATLQICHPKTATTPLGVLRQIVVDDKGLSLMLLFGIKPATSENPSLVAACVCLKLQSTIQVQSLPFQSSCGITTGRIFSGCISNAKGKRLEHAVLGQAVNLAARFMTLAEQGTILCDHVTCDMLSNAHALVKTHPLLEPLKVKGFQDTVPAWLVMESGITKYGSKQSLDASLSTFALSQAVDFRDPNDDLTWQKYISSRKENLSSTIHTFIIEGPSGAGKSYTASRISQFSYKQGFTIWNVPTFEIEQSTAFSCVRQLMNLINRLFIKNETCKQMLLTAEDEFPEKQGIDLIWACLNISSKQISVLKDLQKFILSNVTTSSVQGSSVAATANGYSRTSPDDILQSAIETVVIVLNRLVDILDLMIVFDDCQWLDRYSWSIISAIHVQCPKLLIICISRPAKEYAQPNLQSLYLLLTQSPVTHYIVVGSISLERLKIVVKSKFPKLSNSSKLEELSQRLMEMSSGNAFALDVLLRHIEANINASDITDSVLAVLPKDAKSVFVTQLDSLDPTFQAIVRTAALIGQMFRLSDILSLCEMPETSLDEIQMKIMDWDKFGFMEPLEGNKWRFKHCLISFQISSLMTDEERRSNLRKLSDYFESVLRQSHSNTRKPEILPQLSSIYHTLDDKDSEYQINCKLLSLYHRQNMGFECRKLLLQLTQDKKRFDSLEASIRDKINLIGVEISFVLCDFELTHMFFIPFVSTYGGIQLKKCLVFSVFHFLDSINSLEKVYKSIRRTGQWPKVLDNQNHAQKTKYISFLRTVMTCPEVPHDFALTLHFHTVKTLTCTALLKLNDSFDQSTEVLLFILSVFYAFEKYESAIHLRSHLGLETLDEKKPFMQMVHKFEKMTVSELDNVPFGMLYVIHCIGPHFACFDVNFYLGHQILLYFWRIAIRHQSFRMQEAVMFMYPNVCVKYTDGLLTKEHPLTIQIRSLYRICKEQPAFSPDMNLNCMALGGIILAGAEVYNELKNPVQYANDLKSVPTLDVTLNEIEYADQFVRSRAPPLDCSKNDVMLQFSTSVNLMFFDLYRGDVRSALDYLQRTSSALKRFDGVLRIIYSGAICEMFAGIYMIMAYRLCFPDQGCLPLTDELYNTAMNILKPLVSSCLRIAHQNKSKWRCMKILEVSYYQMQAIQRTMSLKKSVDCEKVVHLAAMALQQSAGVFSLKGEIIFHELSLYMKLGMLPRQQKYEKVILTDKKREECKEHYQRIQSIFAKMNALWTPRHLRRVAELHSLI